MLAGRNLLALGAMFTLACTGGPGPAGDDDDDDDVDHVDAGATSTDAPAFEDPGPLAGGLGTLAGASTPGLVDGARGYARFNNPVNVASDGAGGVLVCDFDNGAIRRIDAAGTTTTAAVAPTGFTRPFGIARRGDTVYLQTDRSTQGQPTGALWKLSLSQRSLTLVRDGAGRYRGLAFLSDGRLIAAEYQRHTIDLIDPASGVATVLAGTTGQAGMVDAPGAAARFSTPYDLAVLPGDLILVADHDNHVLRKVTLDGNVVTYAGDGTAGATDGPRATARFRSPQGLAASDDGTVYVSDAATATIRRIAPGGEVTTIAGTGTPGFADAADPRAAQLHGLEGIDLSPDGAYLFIADGNHGEDLPFHRVRRIML